MTDVAVIGGGVIGLSIALRCARRGLGVAVHDPAPGSGASAVAAGMLAPVTEAHYGEEALTSLALASLALWPAFAAELGLGDAYTEHGTLLVGLDNGDRAELDRQHGFYARLGLESHRLTGSETRALEPLLSPRVRGGVHAPGDHQVDPRRLLSALLSACRTSGVSFVPSTVTSPSSLDASVVVVCAGARDLLGLPVRPVHGQVLRLRGPYELRRTVRGIVEGRGVYIVPRPDGEVAVGASAAERGFDTVPRAGDAYELLRDALEVVPELGEYELREVRAGLRPGTPDNAPILGAVGPPRVIAATGHYRNGILLAPVTAELITELIVTGAEPAGLAPFHPRRFQ